MAGRHQPTNGADSPAELEAMGVQLACPDCGHDVDHTTRCPDGCPGCVADAAQRVQVERLQLRDDEFRVLVDYNTYIVWRPNDENRITYRADNPEEGRYAAMLLNSGIDPEELDGMLLRVRCDRCLAIKFAAELDS